MESVKRVFLVSLPVRKVPTEQESGLPISSVRSAGPRRWMNGSFPSTTFPLPTLSLQR